jgi:colicin import membrane protein
MGQIPAGAGASGGTATADAAPSAAYAGRLVQAIFPNIVFQDTLPGNPAAVVEVRAGPNGSVIGRRLVSSSGHPDWDEAVLRAIDRTGTLPRDADGRVPPVITITFRPR